MASAVSQMAIIMMTSALAAGRSRPHVPTRGSRLTSRLPFTNRSPTIVSTPASPRLKATTRTIPEAARLIDTAVTSRTSAAAVPKDRAGQQRERSHRRQADSMEAVA